MSYTYTTEVFSMDGAAQIEIGQGRIYYFFLLDDVSDC